MRKQPIHTESFAHLSIHQVGILSPLELFEMDQVENVESLNLEYQKNEELFEDKDAEVFDIVLLNGPINVVKQKSKLIKDQGTNIHNVYRLISIISLPTKP